MKEYKDKILQIIPSSGLVAECIEINDRSNRWIQSVICLALVERRWNDEFDDEIETVVVPMGLVDGDIDFIDDCLVNCDLRLRCHTDNLDNEKLAVRRK